MILYGDKYWTTRKIIRDYLVDKHCPLETHSEKSRTQFRRQLPQVVEIVEDGGSPIISGSYACYRRGQEERRKIPPLHQRGWTYARSTRKIVVGFGWFLENAEPNIVGQVLTNRIGAQ